MGASKRILTLQAGLIAVVAVTISGCGGQSLGGDSGGDAASNDTVKVGLQVAESGVYAAAGRDMARGFELYLELHNNELGGKQVELLKADEGDTAQSGVNAVTKLVQQDQVDVLVGIVSGPSAVGARDIIDAAGVPTILGNTGSVRLGTDLKSDWVWRGAYDNGDPGRALGAFMAEDPEAGDFFLLGADYSGGHEHIEGFKETFPSDRILGEVYPPFGSTSDYATYLAQIRASGAENVYAFFAGNEAVQFVKQFKQFGLSDTVNLYGAALTPGVLEATGTSALGVNDVLRYSPDLENSANADFVPAFEEKYGETPEMYSATMYDVAAMLDTALAKIDGDVTRQAINDAMAEIGTIDAVRGELSFDENRTVVQTHYLVQIQEVDGSPAPVTLMELPTP